MTLPRPLVILSNVIIDDVWLADGSHQGHSLGGAAVWAAVGARAWWPGVGIAAGVGEDLPGLSAGLLRDFGLLPDGELVRDAHTIQSRLVYAADGSRSETPALGAAHFHKMQLTPKEIPPTLLPAAATYVFRDVEPAFWHDFEEQAADLGHTLWELSSDIAMAGLWPRVRELLSRVDIVSLNQQEGATLLGCTEPGAMAGALLAAGARNVVLRMGAEGALIASPTQKIQVVPPPAPVTDVTGGGNGFCGGFLAGWCLKPGDLEHAGRCAAASAALCIGQVGLPSPSQLLRAPLLAARAAIIPCDAHPTKA